MKDHFDDGTQRHSNREQNKIRIKTLSEPPSELMKMKYSKTQDIMLKMAEENKELAGNNSKTYYSIHDGSTQGSYGMVSQIKPQPTKLQPPIYSRMSFEPDDKFNKFR